MNPYRMKATHIAVAALFGVLGATALPVHAETEIEALKRELAEQRVLIEKLLAAQNSQKAAIEKIESRPAPAQASSGASLLPPGVTVYGTLDVNVASANSGYGRKTTVGSGGMTASSIGVKGQKELGDTGLRVVAEAEMGIDLTTGVGGNGPNANGVNNAVPSSGGFTGTGSQIFSRQAYAGLANDNYGQLTIGRQYTGSYVVDAVLANAFGPGLYGSSMAYMSNVGSMPARVNNSIAYHSPSFSGFSGWLTWMAGNENNCDGNIFNSVCRGANPRVTDSSGEGIDLALFYRSKTLTAALTTWEVKRANYATNETGLAKNKAWQGVISYDFGFLRLYGAYLTGRVSGG
ncbi:MAG: porin, partial [Azonexus sp.]|nr:porin [Azonexus sp.]